VCVFHATNHHFMANILRIVNNATSGHVTRYSTCTVAVYALSMEANRGCHNNYTYTGIEPSI